MLMILYGNNRKTMKGQGDIKSDIYMHYFSVFITVRDIRNSFENRSD